MHDPKPQARMYVRIVQIDEPVWPLPRTRAMCSDFEIERPIFVVGCGRSGTTILYNLLAGHPDLAWFSHHTNRWPRRPQLAFLSRLHRIGSPYRFRIRGWPVPSEGHAIWDYCKPVQDSPGDPPLTEKDASAADSASIRRLVTMHTRYQGRPRFVNKNTRNTRRIRFLNRIFPDARFIHLVRDPRATIASLLNVNFWPDLKVWCRKRITPREWVAQGKDPAALAALLWVGSVQRALDDSAALPAYRYMEVHYEDLVARPTETLTEVLRFSELEWNERFGGFVRSVEFRNMNFKYRAQLGREQIAEVEDLVTPLARQLGLCLSQGG